MIVTVIVAVIITGTEIVPGTERVSGKSNCKTKIDQNCCNINGDCDIICDKSIAVKITDNRPEALLTLM